MFFIKIDLLCSLLFLCDKFGIVMLNEIQYSTIRMSKNFQTEMETILTPKSILFLL